MNDAITDRVSQMTEAQTVEGLKVLRSMNAAAVSCWDDSTKRVRAELLFALEDVHGWSEYQVDRIDAEIFFDAATLANVDLMYAEGVYA